MYTGVLHETKENLWFTIPAVVSVISLTSSSPNPNFPHTHYKVQVMPVYTVVCVRGKTKCRKMPIIYKGGFQKTYPNVALGTVIINVSSKLICPQFWKILTSKAICLINNLKYEIKLLMLLHRRDRDKKFMGICLLTAEQVLLVLKKKKRQMIQKHNFNTVVLKHPQFKFYQNNVLKDKINEINYLQMS